MARVKSHAQKLKELSANSARDFDPEDESAFRSGSEDSDSEDDGDVGAAREHYETVGKSRLRKPQSVSLGPQYEGRRVRRDALSDEDDDDPFNQNSENDESEDDIEEREDDVSEGEEGDENLNGIGYSSEDEDEGDDNDTDITDEDEMDVDDEDAYAAQTASSHTQNSEQIRKLMAEDSKKVAASLSQTQRENAEKGKAVQQQRRTFDTLLNSRIKLQKALVATNSMLAVEDQDGKADDDVIEAAEAAALNLWNNLNVLRSSLQAGEKRSHNDFTREDSLDAMWNESKEYERAQKKPRTAALDKWARTTRATTALPQARGRLQQPVKEQQLSDVLAGQLADMERLIAKTRVPRSCAPVQAANASKKAAANTNDTQEAGDEDEQPLPIYDDADFYTTLLANLISQRSADTAVNLGNLSIQPWQAAREAKTKKVVDTKASKGRKLRYTVHEKLVSFMAPEDRGDWPESKSEEFFAGLLGRRVVLDEIEASDAADEDDPELAGLRLFGGR